MKSNYGGCSSSTREDRYSNSETPLLDGKNIIARVHRKNSFSGFSKEKSSSSVKDLVVRYVALPGLTFVLGCWFGGPGAWAVRTDDLIELVDSTTSAAAASSAASGEGGVDSDTFEDLTDHALVLFTITSVLITVTIFFEAVKQKVLNECEELMAPVMNSLFSELTVLGFISLVSFLVEKTAPLPEKYLEAVEQVHFLLFGVMIVYIGLVLHTLTIGKRAMLHWKALESESTHGPDPGAHLKGLLEGERGVRLTRAMLDALARARLDPYEVSASHAYAHLVYYSLRREFLLNRQQFPPFEGLTAAQLPKDFDYSRYLSICFGKAIAKVIELPPQLWGAVWLTLCLFVGFLVLVPSFSAFAWFFMAASYVVLVATIALYWKTRHIFTMTIDLSHFPDTTKNIIGHAEAGNNEPDGPKLISAPLWTVSDQTIAKKHGCLSKLLFGSRQPTPQENLYWGGRKARGILYGSLRFLLLYHAINFCIAFGFLVEYVVKDYGWVIGTVYFFLAGFPAFFTFRYLKGKLVTNIVHTTSIGPFRRRKIIDEVLRWQKTARAVGALVLVNNMALKFEQEEQEAAPRRSPRGSMSGKKGSGVGGGGALRRLSDDQSDVPPGAAADQKPGKDARRRRMDTAHSLFGGDKTEAQDLEAAMAAADFDLEAWVDTLDDARRLRAEGAAAAFDALDDDESGELEAEELETLLQRLGVHVSPTRQAAILRSLDHDGDGSISRQEFILWHLIHTEEEGGHGAAARKRADPAVLAQQLFARFDEDQSGSVTLTEFREGIKRVLGHHALTDEEISELIIELDQNHDKMIDLDEFIVLLTKYHSDTTSPYL